MGIDVGWVTRRSEKPKAPSDILTVLRVRQMNVDLELWHVGWRRGAAYPTYESDKLPS